MPRLHTVNNPDPIYKCWCSMIYRCYNPASPGYANYGGRGITVCQQWRDDIRQFAADMGPRPPDHSIDRRNNDGNYCPENCRWADQATQQNNKRSNRLFTIDGETKTLSEWAKLRGVRRDSLGYRINRMKWTIEKALSEPLTVRLYTIDGETKTLIEWADLHGIKPTTVRWRINKSKWTIEKALSEPLTVGRPKT